MTDLEALDLIERPLTLYVQCTEDVNPISMAHYIAAGALRERVDREAGCAASAVLAQKYDNDVIKKTVLEVVEMAKLPTMETLARQVADAALDVEHAGRTLREWIALAPQLIKPEPKTMGARIRMMDDLALAQWLYDLLECNTILHFCKDTGQRVDAMDNGDEIPDARCVQCLAAWLGREVDCDD